MSDGDSSRVPDPYRRSEYRRLIAWDQRIQREGPFLRELLEPAPERAVLDLGCGTGEHVAFFARTGARSVGLDRSESMLERAREHEARGEGRFVLGDATAARAALAGEPPFGLAICLGNMLPHLLEESDVAAFFAETHGLLAPGGRFLLQILNYRRILEQGIRHLPVSFRPGDDDEQIVFLRLLEPVDSQRILFFPITLTLDVDAEEPVTLRSSRRVELRPWTDTDLAPLLEACGFSVQLHGDMEGGAYDPQQSSDLVIVAKRD